MKEVKGIRTGDPSHKMVRKERKTWKGREAREGKVVKGSVICIRMET